MYKRQHRIIEDYLNEENHLAVISVDGGNFTSQFEKLPPITYSVELNPTKARETLEEKGVKAVSYTHLFILSVCSFIV